jgi:DUF2911 family protein
LNRGTIETATETAHSTENLEEDKMRKFGMVVLSVLMLASFAALGFAQGNPRGKATLTLGGKTVSVEYGRPSLKGRTTDDLLGKLPSGGFWRLGADTSTTYKSDADVDFGSALVPAGTYSLWMQRGAQGHSWSLVFNRQHGQWGTDHDASQDAVTLPLNTLKADNPVEALTITLKKTNFGGNLEIQWGSLREVASFKVK